MKKMLLSRYALGHHKNANLQVFISRYMHEKNLGVVATMMVDFKFKTVIAIINKVCTADLQIIGPWTSFIQTGCAVKGAY